MTRYKPEDITVTLQREQNNAHNRNAIQIIAAVCNKGAAVIGYINRELAAALGEDVVNHTPDKHSLPHFV